ncbi:hypothetical protein [Nonomuraea harbinensis]|uniref:Uncharacterized protein n=1 Tax=Nonomuraea harbinensis TaxID=1286938 RepID=A0ABW1BTM0_9ACTN|nr:hypothetical protein [Nonomuraea harbinensis]
MRVRTAAWLAALALGLAGCGASTAGGPTTAATPPPPTAEPSPAPCRTAEPVVALGDAVDPLPVAWTSAEPVSDGHGLLVTWTSGVAPCRVLDRVDVSYGTDTVQVTLYEGSDPDVRDPVCVEIAIEKQTLVKLREPVAGREIVDGAGPSPS